MKKNTIMIYLFFAFLLAWTVWGALPLLDIPFISPMGNIVGAIPTFAPAAAVWITKKFSGKIRIMEPSMKPKFKGNIRWYVLSWFMPSLLCTTFSAILYFSTFPSQLNIKMFETNHLPIIPILIRIFMVPIFALPFILGEEIGWRGFLFPAIRSHTTARSFHKLLKTCNKIESFIRADKTFPLTLGFLVSFEM